MFGPPDHLNNYSSTTTSLKLIQLLKRSCEDHCMMSEQAVRHMRMCVSLSKVQCDLFQENIQNVRNCLDVENPFFKCLIQLDIFNKAYLLCIVCPRI